MLSKPALVDDGLYLSIKHMYVRLPWTCSRGFYKFTSPTSSGLYGLIRGIEVVRWLYEERTCQCDNIQRSFSNSPILIKLAKSALTRCRQELTNTRMFPVEVGKIVFWALPERSTQEVAIVDHNYNNIKRRSPHILPEKTSPPPRFYFLVAAEL